MRAVQSLMIVVAAAAISSCATIDGAGRSNLISPSEAIESAAAAAPRSVQGQFAIRVKGVGRQGGNIYLNSETDYRDQRNLTIAILPSAIGPLAQRYGSDPDVFLIGKRIVVSGEARRTQIHFTADGRPTGKYYFQTHVRVGNADQISVVTGNE